MTTERNERARAIFQDAVEIDPAARAQLLRERCGGDEELLREVESLLVSDGNTPASVLPGNGQMKAGAVTAAAAIFQNKVTLRSAIAPGGMDFARAANIVREIGLSLTAMHEKGVRHCDLTAEKIVLERHGQEERARLIDMEMAAVQGAQLSGETTETAGSADDESHEARDTYALGLIACELLTTKEPSALRQLVADNTSEQTVLRQLRPDLSAAAEWSLMKATSLQPGNRYASVSEFSEDLYGALSGGEPSRRMAVPGKLQIAHVLFTDLVSYSLLPMDRQKEYLRELQQIVRKSTQFRAAEAAGDLVSLPTGDGMALVFSGDPTAPVQCAVELASELKSRPHLKLRMGIHSGPIYRVADINANANVAGGAINTAQRVMDCGDAGHILLSKNVAEVLLQLSEWSPCLTDFGECTVKHGVKVHIFNLATPEVGNPVRPGKLALAAVPKAKSKRPRAIASVLVAIAAAGALWFGRGRVLPAGPDEASIAVLPFADMTPEKNLEYLSDGLAEELLNELTNSQGLKVAGRTSSFQFRGNTDGSRVIGEKLGVATILEGSVRKQDNRARIAVELVRARDGFTLWSKTFDRDMNDIFAVEQEIALAVMGELKPKLLGTKLIASSTKSPNDEAYNLYLQAKYFYGQRNKENLEKSVDYFQQAIKLDPGYARAWAGLAKSRSAQADAGYIPSEKAYQEAREAAERALQLDPNLGEAHAALGWIRMYYDWNWTSAEASFQRALALEPGNVTQISLAGVLSAIMGRLDEAIARHRQAIGIDPLNPIGYRNMGLYLYYAGQEPKAAAALKKALELAPEGAVTHSILSQVYLTQTQRQEALSEANKEKDLDRRLQGLALAYYALGQKTESDANLKELTSKFADDPFYIAEVYAFRKETDQAFEWLERAYTIRDIGLTQIKVDPLLKSLKPDSRYALLLRQMRLPL